MIEIIETSRIYPHPNNPRITLGDLTGLTEDIKRDGILQPLTIIPKNPDEHRAKKASKKRYTGDYTVLAGHRRRAAAEMAGLSELPCIIVYMDEIAQLTTIVRENIHRADLSHGEQGKVMQLMLDKGESVKSISEKTSIGEDTIRKKVKVFNCLGAELLSQEKYRQVSLTDCLKVCEINDPNLRADVFESLGTNNFTWKYDGAKKEDIKAAVKAQIIEIMSGFARETDAQYYEGVSSDNSVSIKESGRFHRFDSTDVKAVQGLASARDTDAEYFYTETKYGALIVYTIGEAEDTPNAAAETEQERQRMETAALVEKIKELFSQAYKLRIAFAKGFRVSSNTQTAVSGLVARGIYGLGHCNESAMRYLFDIKKPFRQSWQSGDDETMAQVAERLIGEAARQGRNQLETMIFRGAYCRVEPGDVNCVNHNGGYFKNESLIRVYEILKSLGYEASDDELQLIDGTHPLYITTSEEIGDAA